MPSKPSTIEVRELAELTAAAKRIIAAYPQPTIFALHGKMGAGKTTLVNALCRELGAQKTASPTFSLVNEYEGNNGVRIFHFDLYRLNRSEEAMDIGFEDYLDRNAYVFIEWPELVLDLLDEPVHIEITSHSDGVRTLVLS
jgi:tRNA threonylcarbamoyladenosine biosynthesis protein TsaE